MKKQPAPILFAVLLAASWEIAHAQNPESPEKPEKKNPAAAWKAADLDNDQFISKEEFDKMPRIQKLPAEKQSNLFNRLDKDTDGKLSLEEVKPMAQLHHGHRDKPMKRLWEFDADKSGGISFDEFRASPITQKLPAEKQEALFKRLDSDADGSITPKDKPADFKRDHQAEAQAPGPAFWNGMIEKNDIDADQQLSFEEFRQALLLKKLGEDQQEDRFNEIDTDKNLKISADELSAMQKKNKMSPPSDTE